MADISFRIDKLGDQIRPITKGYGYLLQTGDYFVIDKLSGNETIIAQGGDAQLEVNPGRIDVINGGYLWDLELSSGSIYPCAETNGDIIFDASTYKLHGKIHAQDFNNLHQEFVDGRGTNFLNDYGYSNIIKADIISFNYNGSSNDEFIYIELEKDNDVFLFEDTLVFSGTSIKLTDIKSYNIGMFTPIKKLDFTDVNLEMDISLIKDWNLIGDVYFKGTSIYGDITELLNWRLTGNLILSGLNITGNISGLQNCNLSYNIDLSNTNVEGDIGTLSNSKYLQYINLNDTNISGNISQLSELRSLKTINLQNTNVEGMLDYLKDAIMNGSINIANTNIQCGLFNLRSWNISGDVNFSNTYTIGDLSVIKHWPTNKPIFFDNTQVSECSIQGGLFPNSKELHFANCPLSRNAVDNILISKDLDGLTNGYIDLSNTKTPSDTGFIAYNNLLDKGWVIDIPVDGDLFLDVQSTVDSPDTLRYVINCPSYKYNGEVHNGSALQVIFPKTQDVQIHLFYIEDLKEFQSINNKLSGSFPYIDGAINLEILKLRYNLFSGIIPNLSNFSNLSVFDVENNLFDDFEGGVAPSTLTYVNCSYNNMSSEGVSKFLIALDSSGATDGTALFIGDNMGAPTESGAAAAENLKNKGWTVEYKGIYKDPVCDNDVVYDFWVLQDDTVMGGC